MEARRERTYSSASVDIVTAFQAFHWFNPEPTLLEFRRILKPTGRLAVVWNNRDREDAFTGEYSRIVKAASNNHPGESRVKSVEPLLETQLFVNVREFAIAYCQELNGRSFNRTCDERGLVYVVYRTSVHLAEPSSI